MLLQPPQRVCTCIIQTLINHLLKMPPTNIPFPSIAPHYKISTRSTSHPGPPVIPAGQLPTDIGTAATFAAPPAPTAIAPPADPGPENSFHHQIPRPRLLSLQHQHRQKHLQPHPKSTLTLRSHPHCAFLHTCSFCSFLNPPVLDLRVLAQPLRSHSRLVAQLCLLLFFDCHLCRGLCFLALAY